MTRMTSPSGEAAVTERCAGILQDTGLMRHANALAGGLTLLERKRLVAPYRLFYGGKTEKTELIYTYEEDVFDPESPELRNLSSMMAAQIALNYGLFCREIVFNGIFDTVPLTLSEWVLLLPLIFLPSIATELTKLIMQLLNTRRPAEAAA
mgnify:CR=1 FL=1